MDIFSSQAGRVTAVDGDFMPMLMEIGDDPKDVHPSANWSGYDEMRSIVTGIGVQQQGGYQIIHTLRDFLYVYVFGERIGQLTINGLSFNANCESGYDALVGDNPNVIGAQYHGLEWVQAYYLDNRITHRPDPITIVLGLDTPFTGFLTGFRMELLDVQSQPFIGRFSMGFHIIPDSGDLVDALAADVDDDPLLASQLEFSAQLQAEAKAKTGQPGVPPPPGATPPQLPDPWATLPGFMNPPQPGTPFEWPDWMPEWLRKKN